MEVISREVPQPQPPGSEAWPTGKVAAENVKESIRMLRGRYAVGCDSLGTKSTIGMILESTMKVKGIVPGGPLDKNFDGERVEEGDLVLAIDGKPSTQETVQADLIGHDVVGSRLRMTVQKASNGQVFMVSVLRGSLPRLQAIGQLHLMFKEIQDEVAYGKTTTVGDISALEQQFHTVCRFSTSYLENLRLHVLDLEKLALKTLETTILRHAERALLRRWQQQTKREAWRVWHFAYDDCRYREQLLHSVTAIVRRWQQQATEAAWSIWYHEHCKRKTMAKLLMRVSRAPASLKRALSKWQALVWISRRLRAAAARWMYAQVCQAWDTWQIYAEGVRRMRTIAGKVVGRGQMAALSGRFAVWAEQVDEGRRLRRVAKQVVRRWAKTDTAWYVGRWRAWCVGKGRGKAMMRRGQTSALSGRFAVWMEQADEGRRLRRVAKQVVRRWAKADTAWCVGRWRAWCLSKGRGKALMSRIMGRWTRMGMTIALRAWVTQGDSQRMLRETLRKRRALKTHLIFASWSDFSEDRKMLLRHTSRIVQHEHHHLLEGGFEAFNVSRLRQYRLRAARQCGSAHMPVVSMSRAFERWSDQVDLWLQMRNEQHLAFSRWAQQLFDLRVNCKNIVFRFICKARLHDQSWAFDEWSSFVAKGKLARSRCAEIILCFQRPVLKMVLDAWRVFLVGEIRARTDKNTKLSMMTGIAAMLLACSVTACQASTFAKWSSTSSELIQRRDSLGKHATDHQLQSHLSQVLLAWKSETHRADGLCMQPSLNSHENFLDRAAALHRRWHLLLASGPLLQWANVVNRRQRWMQVIVVARRCWKKCSMSLAWETWEAHLSAAVDLRTDGANQAASIAMHGYDTLNVTLPTPPRGGVISPPLCVQEESLPTVANNLSAGVNPSASVDSWWSNMQRNMSFSDLRLAHKQDGKRTPRPDEERTSLTSPASRSGSLRFAESPP